MKKFAFLLALIAILAMSAAAWADSGVKELKTVRTAIDSQVNGEIAAGSAPGSDGNYCTKLYHIGPAAKEGEGKIYFDLDLHEAAAGKYLKAVSSSVVYALIGSDPLDSSTELSQRSFFLPGSIATVAQFVIGIADAKTTSSLSSGADTKTLDVIPVRVEFDSAIEVSAKAGSTASLNIKDDFDDGNPGVRLITLGTYDTDYVISYSDGDAAKSLTPGTAAVVGGLSLTYDPDTLALTVKNDRPTPAASGTKVVLEIVTNFQRELYINEDGGLSGNINVSGIGEGVAIGTIAIDVIDDPTPPGPTPGPTPPAETVIELIEDEPENENASDKIKQAIRGGTTNFLLTLGGSDGRKIESVNGKTDDGADDVKVLSGDKGQVQMRMAFLALDGFGGLKVADDAPSHIHIVITNDGDGADSTASFDVTDLGIALPNETAEVKADGSASFSVGSKSTGGARSGFYTMSVISGRKLRTGGIAAVAKDGEVLASQKLRVDDGTQRRSSGGACDTGAGLAAAAGLAALALRKRSK